MQSRALMQCTHRVVDRSFACPLPSTQPIPIMQRQSQPHCTTSSTRHPHTIAAHKPSHHCASPPANSRAKGKSWRPMPNLAQLSARSTRCTRSRLHLTFTTRRKCNHLQCQPARCGPCGAQVESWALRRRCEWLGNLGVPVKARRNAVMRNVRNSV